MISSRRGKGLFGDRKCRNKGVVLCLEQPANEDPGHLAKRVERRVYTLLFVTLIIFSLLQLSGAWRGLVARKHDYDWTVLAAKRMWTMWRRNTHNLLSTEQVRVTEQTSQSLSYGAVPYRTASYCMPCVLTAKKTHGRDCMCVCVYVCLCVRCRESVGLGQDQEDTDYEYHSHPGPERADHNRHFQWQHLANYKVFTLFDCQHAWISGDGELLIIGEAIQLPRQGGQCPHGAGCRPNGDGQTAGGMQIFNFYSKRIYIVSHK